MGNSLRCCLACILPCGALDVIRIVHLNGHVDEYSRPVAAGEILSAHPNHVLSKPCSEGDARMVRRILIVSPDSDLKRGQIYFLIPASSVPEKKKKKLKKIDGGEFERSTEKESLEADNYLKQILSEKKSSHRRRGSSGARVAVWRPHLESISEVS